MRRCCGGGVSPLRGTTPPTSDSDSAKSCWSPAPDHQHPRFVNFMYFDLLLHEPPLSLLSLDCVGTLTV
jgi:hypothetical protein